MLGAISSIVGAAAAGYLGYATMAPGSQLYGRTLTHGSDPGQIALTYDDGPNDPHTLRLLDVLAEHQAKATFFLIGQYVKKRPDIARAIQAAGHAIGNHTFTHPNLVLCSSAKLNQELSECGKALEDAIGTPVRLFRPPFGGRRPDVLGTVRAKGMEPVMWSVTAFDWSARSSEFIVDKVTKEVDRRRGKRSEIVLLHDGGHLGFGADRGFTVEATKALLNKYADKKFVAIPELTR
jgi:peptidoglycan/xylan/chitin deacetylase (PgdA/CDA1 family)